MATVATLSVLRLSFPPLTKKGGRADDAANLFVLSVAARKLWLANLIPCRTDNWSFGDSSKCCRAIDRSVDFPTSSHQLSLRRSQEGMGVQGIYPRCWFWEIGALIGSLSSWSPGKNSLFTIPAPLRYVRMRVDGEGAQAVTGINSAISCPFWLSARRW